MFLSLTDWRGKKTSIVYKWSGKWRELKDVIPAILFYPYVRVLHLLWFKLCNTLLSHEAIRAEDLVVKYRGLWTRSFFLSVSGCRYQGSCLVKKVVKGSSCLSTPQILLWEKCHWFLWVWSVFIFHSFIPTECISTNK